jgi:hypothetical protein
MYPLGYKVLSEIETYIESEEELDQIVLNSSTNTNQMVCTTEDEDDIDICISSSAAPRVASRVGNETPLLVLPNNVMAFATLPETSLTSTESAVTETATTTGVTILPIPFTFQTDPLERVNRSKKVCMYCSISLHCMSDGLRVE